VSPELVILCTTAASVALMHTLLGPDHYLPFIAMARAGRWSAARTAWITVLCGIGHILSSVLLGVLGISCGIALGRLEAAESVRGTLAAWGLAAFGLVYFLWGLRRARARHGHEHVHLEAGGTSLKPWVLFTIFVLGPCEPLIPLLMYPAARSSVLGLWLVTGIFAGVTIAAMLGVVLVSFLGIHRLPLGPLERYSHALAGAIICLCGVGIQVLGL